MDSNRNLTENTSRETAGGAVAPGSDTEAAIGRFIETKMECAVNVALAEIRDEGYRWRGLLEQLSLTLQFTAEETARQSSRPLESMLESMLDRLVSLEQRVEALSAGQNLDLPPPVEISNDASAPSHGNPKGILQVRCVAHGMDAPKYTEVRRTGTPDAPTFLVACTIPEKAKTCTGVGSTKRSAHQTAAATMLRLLDWPAEFPSDEEREAIREGREAQDMMEESTPL